jgi:hypothetical protein
MALVGNCYNITYSDHPTETKEMIRVLPDGTEIKETVPVEVENIETYENIYLVITQVENFNYWLGNEKEKSIFIFYKAFKSEEDRNLNQDNFLFEKTMSFGDIDLNKPLYSQIYAKIKQQKGFETLVDK